MEHLTSHGPNLPHVPGRFDAKPSRQKTPLAWELLRVFACDRRSSNEPRSEVSSGGICAAGDVSSPSISPDRYLVNHQFRG